MKIGVWDLSAPENATPIPIGEVVERVKRNNRNDVKAVYLLIGGDFHPVGKVRLMEDGNFSVNYETGSVYMTPQMVVYVTFQREADVPELDPPGGSAKSGAGTTVPFRVLLRRLLRIVGIGRES